MSYDFSATVTRFRAAAAQRQADFTRGTADGFRWAKDTAAHLDDVIRLVGFTGPAAGNDPVADAATAISATVPTGEDYTSGYHGGFVQGAREVLNAVYAAVGRLT